MVRKFKFWLKRIWYRIIGRETFSIYFSETPELGDVFGLYRQQIIYIGKGLYTFYDEKKRNKAPKE